MSMKLVLNTLGVTMLAISAFGAAPAANAMSIATPTVSAVESIAQGSGLVQNVYYYHRGWGYHGGWGYHRRWGYHGGWGYHRGWCYYHPYRCH